MWWPCYAAARAEATALAELRDPGPDLDVAVVATRQNPVAATLVRRALALARGDLEEVAATARTFEEQGALYQRDRSLRLAGG